MAKLSDTQSTILSQASRHDALLATAPANLPAAARQAVFRSMLKNQLLEELPAPAEHLSLGWRQDDEGAWIALRITGDGMRAIGVEPEEPSDFGAEPRELTADEEAKELTLQQEALDAENAAEAVLAGQGTERPLDVPATGRQGLRAAATAAVAAWKAQNGLEEALGALKAALGSPKAARTPGAPRKAREDTKQHAVLALLRREEGATIAQVMEATGWQQHTVRGFLAGLKKKGFTVEVLARVKQVGSGKQGAKGSYSIYRLAGPVAG
jgi:hypothetical protein